MANGLCGLFSNLVGFMKAKRTTAPTPDRAADKAGEEDQSAVGGGRQDGNGPQPTSNAEREIRETVIRTLRAARGKNCLSMPQPAEPHRIILEVDWDPRSFVAEQQYNLPPEDAIPNAITVTGSPDHCQALTASQYLTQTWALTGNHMVRLVRGVLSGEQGERYSGKIWLLQHHKQGDAAPGLELHLRPHHCHAVI